MELGSSTGPQSRVESEVSNAQVRTEIQDYLHVSRQRRRLFPRAALVGLVTGLMATAFRAALAGGDNLRNAIIVWARHFPTIGWIIPMLFGAIGAGIGLALVKKYAPEAAGSGIPHLEAVLQRMRELNWKRVLPVKFFGGACAIGGGLALGREGPTVQMGGAVGAAVSDWLKAGTPDRLVLIAAGAGAGLTAAFNAPLAGVMFVLEEVQKDFRQAVFASAFVAAAVSDIVARAASGQLPVFKIPYYRVPDLKALPAFAILGICAGILGVIYNRSLIGTIKLFARVPRSRMVAAAAGVGACCGLAAWFAPTSVGGGHALAETFLRGDAALAVIPLWFAGRFVLSMASYGAGTPGGIFAPLLVLGALLGLGVGDVTHHLFPHLVPVPAIFAVVGMAAYFTAIVRAPLTGIVLIVEMTNNYTQMLPLLVACFCAYAVAEGMGELPIYEHLLERDLRAGGAQANMKEAQVLHLEVEPGSPFDGREVRHLGLPGGCILVSCRDGAHEWIPTAATRLAAHVRISAVVSPEAIEAVALLRAGCESAA